MEAGAFALKRYWLPFAVVSAPSRCSTKQEGALPKEALDRWIDRYL
jgi:hypothetical protein